MRVFDLATERVVHVLGPHNDLVMELMFTVDDEHIVALDDSDLATIWDVATGAQIHSFSFKTHDWHRSLAFSSNTVGIRVHCDAGPRTIGVWTPKAQQVSFSESDGWVYAGIRDGSRRLCWLPPEWRTIMRSDGGTLCLKEAKSDAHPHGRVIGIDMSRIIAYIDNLPPDCVVHDVVFSLSLMDNWRTRMIFRTL